MSLASQTHAPNSGSVSRAPPSVVTNVRVQRELTARAALSLDVPNVFDREYYDIAYEQDYRLTPTGPVVPDGVTVHPGAPRELRLTLRLARCSELRRESCRRA